MGIPMACVRWETPVLLTVESLPPKQCLAQRGCSVFVQGIINNTVLASPENRRGLNHVTQRQPLASLMLLPPL